MLEYIPNHLEVWPQGELTGIVTRRQGKGQHWQSMLYGESGWEGGGQREGRRAEEEGGREGGGETTCTIGLFHLVSVHPQLMTFS